MIIMFDGFHDYQSIVTIKHISNIEADRRSAERFSGLYQDDRSRELRTQDKTWVGKMEILGNW